MGIEVFKPVRISLGPDVRRGSQADKAMRVIEAHFSDWALHVAGQSEAVMEEALLPTLEKAKRYCPVDTGFLRRSGYVETRRGGHGFFEAEIGFGINGHPHYTVWVHEIAKYYHKPPTQSKFLQTAILEDERRIIKAITSGYARAASVQ